MQSGRWKVESGCFLYCKQNRTKQLHRGLLHWTWPLVTRQTTTLEIYSKQFRFILFTLTTSNCYSFSLKNDGPLSELQLTFTVVHINSKHIENHLKNEWTSVKAVFILICSAIPGFKTECQDLYTHSIKLLAIGGRFGLGYDWYWNAPQETNFQANLVQLFGAHQIMTLLTTAQTTN